MDYSTYLETVYQAVFALNDNPNPLEKEKASCYLNDLQNSICAWKMADDMLHQKRDLVSCYFAAQTLRKKIQLSFHELPLDSHASLRDSLLNHVSQIDKNTKSIILTQLCLALADLILQMPSWLNPITDLTLKFGSSESQFWLLVEILTVLAEELDSRILRLSLDRKDQIIDHFRLHVDSILQVLLECLVKDNDIQMAVRVFKCLTSWTLIDTISITTPVIRKVIDLAFVVLESKICDSRLHEVTSDFVSATLQVLEEVKLSKREKSMTEMQQFQLHLFDRIVNLKQSYHDSVATGNIDKSTNYCRIFTELAEKFLETFVDRSVKNNPHFTISALDLVLHCVDHHDHEVAHITFNFWYKLSEILFRRNNDDITAIFENYIEKLINSLCRLCQLKHNHEGLIEEDSDFAEFRFRVIELIKDVVFIIGSNHLFTEMVSKLPNSSWEIVESALFVMTAVAKSIPPEDDKIVPSVVEDILNQAETTHVAVTHMSILLLGELSEWMDQHPQALERTLNFLFICLNHKELGSAACIAIESICAACPSHITSNFLGLMLMARSLNNFAVDCRAANDLLGGVAKVLSRLPKDQVEGFMIELCWLQARHLCYMIEQNVSVQKDGVADPVMWLDRLSMVFRNVKIHVHDTHHPCAAAANEMWPVLSAVFITYQADSRIMERCCRTMRFAIRCLDKHSEHLLQPLAVMIVQLYARHKHSCFLYLGSILVDVFSIDTKYVSGLLAMLDAFVNPTFVMLQQTDGLQNNPAVVDDLFRLCWRFLQTASVPFLQTPMINNIVDCALVACSLDHRDANASVMKFLFQLIHSGRSGQSKSDFKMRQQIVRDDILCKKGQVIVWRLVHAVAYSLSSSALSDVADVLIELTLINKDSMSDWLKRALSEIKSDELMAEKLLKFHRDVIKAETTKKVADALRQFSRLFYSKSIVKGVKK